MSQIVYLTARCRQKLVCCASPFTCITLQFSFKQEIAAVLECVFLCTGTFAMSHNTRKSQISVQADDEELDKIKQQLLEFQQKEQHSKHPVMSQLRSQEKSRLSIESV